MIYESPKCYGCKFFKSPPQSIGGKASCGIYKRGCPDKVFFEGKPCPKFAKKAVRKKK